MRKGEPNIQQLPHASPEVRAIREAFIRQHFSITCPKCGRTSWNFYDYVYRYCGACHQFHEDMK